MQKTFIQRAKKSFNDNPLNNSQENTKSIIVNPLRTLSVIKWFKIKRKTTNINYLNTYDEKRKLRELELLFQKFDEDGSGTLEMDELFNMFLYVGINIGYKNIITLFSQCDEKETNPHPKKHLTLKEFQKLMLSEHTNAEFRKIMKEYRHKIREDEFSGFDVRSIFIPTDLNEMLSFLYRKTI